jgi:uncharacterized protein (DUF58 family)
LKRNLFAQFRFQLPALALLFVVPHPLAQAVLLAYLFVSLLCFLYARWQCRGAQAERNFTLARVYCSQEIEVVITVRNRSPFTFHHLLVSDHRGELTVRGATVGLFSVTPGQRAVLVYRAHADRRGDFTLGPFVLSGSDPLGMFPWDKNDRVTARVIVYPRIYDLTLAHRSGLPAGAIKTDDPAYEDVTAYRSLREYRPGDDLRRVNWKVSARLASLFTMQYSPSLRFSAIILLNLTERDYPLRYRSALVENAIEVAASLVLMCLTLRQEAGLLCEGRLDGEERAVYFPVAAHAGSAVLILEALARIRPGTGRKRAVDGLFAQAVRLQASARIFYVGPVPDADALNRLRLLKRRGYHPECFFCGKQDRPAGGPGQIRLPHRFIEDMRLPYVR